MAEWKVAQPRTFANERFPARPFSALDEVEDENDQRDNQKEVD